METMKTIPKLAINKRNVGFSLEIYIDIEYFEKDSKNDSTVLEINRNNVASDQQIIRFYESECRFVVQVVSNKLIF